jgi:hypothetical protein
MNQERGVEWKPLVWRRTEKAFKEIKRPLINARTLSLPNVMKPFFLYVHDRMGTAIEVLIQLLGP